MSMEGYWHNSEFGRCCMAAVTSPVCHKLCKHNLYDHRGIQPPRVNKIYRKRQLGSEHRYDYLENYVVLLGTKLQ